MYNTNVQDVIFYNIQSPSFIVAINLRDNLFDCLFPLIANLKQNSVRLHFFAGTVGVIIIMDLCFCVTILCDYFMTIHRTIILALRTCSCEVK